MHYISTALPVTEKEEEHHERDWRYSIISNKNVDGASFLTLMAKEKENWVLKSLNEFKCQRAQDNFVLNSLYRKLTTARQFVMSCGAFNKSGQLNKSDVNWFPGIG